MKITKIGLVKVDNNVEIGRCHWCGGGKTMGFNGMLDEIKLWRAALTAEEWLPSVRSSVRDLWLVRNEALFFRIRGL